VESDGLSFDFDIGYLLDNVGGIVGKGTSLGPLDRTGEDLVSERFEETPLLGPHVITCLGVEDRTTQAGFVGFPPSLFFLPNPAISDRTHHS
jgi:hypothetical protein